jgi:adenosine kinase
MISPNDPGAMGQYVRECHELGLAYVYDPSQQIIRLSGADLLAGIEGARAIFVNDYEYALIQKATGLDEANILSRVGFMVVTRGVAGADVFASGQMHHIPVVLPEQIVDPTGVGDAFRGGFLAGLSHGLDWETCGRMGVLAATYCLEQRGPQGHHYTPAEFVARFRRHFDDGGQLDGLANH